MIKFNIWPSFLLLLLGANVAVVLVTMTLANRDGGPAIAPEYDSRALRWDAFREARRRSDELGWTLQAAVQPGPGGAGEVKLRLTARDGQAIESVMLKVTIFHNASPNHPFTLNMSTNSEGIASAPIPFDKAGLYAVHAESAATRSRAQFMCDLEVGSSLPEPIPPLTPLETPHTK